VLAIDSDPAPYCAPEGVRAAFRRTCGWWQKRAEGCARLADPAFTPWLRWVEIQPVLRRICGCSFLPHHDYGRGGRGWRDLWQDSLALLLAEPEAVRDDLKAYFAGVRTDGTNATIIGSRPGEFRADRNNIPRVWMDHGYWPLVTTALYLDETGDCAFLLERQPYFEDGFAFRGELPRAGVAEKREGTVLEHLLVQNVTAFFDAGGHGHIRLRGADWNDGLDMAPARGESVAFTAAYAANFDTLAALLERLAGRGEERTELSAALERLLEFDPARYGDPAARREALFAYCREAAADGEKRLLPARRLADRLREMGEYLKRHIRETEWVGDGADQHWFNSCYDDHGRQAEGAFGKTVRMMLPGQVFTLLSGTADERQARQLIRAADWYLCQPGRGGVCLNTDFGEVKTDLGRMFGFAYGSKENGAVFSHMAVLYAYALYARGFAAEGWRVLEQLYLQSSQTRRSGILPGIPEYFDLAGRGMYPYLTGAASWLLLTVRTQMFGVRGEDGALVLEPRLTAAQFGPGRMAFLRCRFAGRTLEITSRNPELLEYGDYQLGLLRLGESETAVHHTRAALRRASLAGEGTLRILAELEPRRSGRERHV
jgi:cellobiose phosphorylase